MSGSTRHRFAAIALVAVLAPAMAACGGDDDGGDESASATAGGETASAGGVTTETIDGTDALVDSDGRVLYSADQEQGGKVLCIGGCTSVWRPVPASEGSGAPSELMLDEVARPDGAKQLTYDDAPLYTFTEEGPGELSGDGIEDSFGGTDFTWHAATTSGVADSSSEGESSDSSGGTGGYGY